MSPVVHDWPPNIEEIRAVLPVTERNIFAYAGKIYNPGGGKLSLSLHAHEEVHFLQQAEVGVEEWWKKFLEDESFRLEQEIPAHREEHRVFCRHNRDRNDRARHLRALGQRLAAPMYGSLLTVNEAMKKIR